MAALPVEIRGTLYDLMSKSSRQVYIVGDAIRSDVGIGGGPVIPPEGGSGGDGKPPGIWGGPIDPYPGHPLPEPPGKPTEPPEPPSADKPPPPGGGWGWMASASAWGYFPGPGQPGPR